MSTKNLDSAMDWQEFEGFGAGFQATASYVEDPTRRHTRRHERM